MKPIPWKSSLIVVFLCFLANVTVYGQDSSLPPPVATLRYGDLINEYLASDGAVTFSFEGTQSDSVVVQMNSTEFDTALELTGPDGTVLIFNDDYNSLNAQIGPYSLPETGTYTIVSYSYWLNEGGNFTLSLLREDMVVDLSQVELTILADERGIQGGNRIYELPLQAGDVATIVIGTWDPIKAYVANPSAEIVGEVSFNQPLRLQAQETGTYFITVGWVPETQSFRDYEVIDACGYDAAGNVACTSETATELVVIPVAVDFTIAYHIQSGEGNAVVPTEVATNEESTPIGEVGTGTIESDQVCANDIGQAQITLSIDDVVINDSVEAGSAFSSGGDEAILLYAIGQIEGDNFDLGANEEYLQQWEADVYDGDSFNDFPSITRTLSCGDTVGIAFRGFEDDRPFGDLRELGAEFIEFELAAGQIPDFDPSTELRFTGEYDSPYDYAIFYTVTVTSK